jgi:double-stranded uracil-DNA glycosylase
MSQVQSFAPLIGTQPRVLILGSMPGVKSLQDQQYYAHPRNAFWPILGELFSVQWSHDYQQKINQIQQLPLILWDVLQSCQREGSLDSDIKSDQLQGNSIDQLLLSYPTLSFIAFNGGTAEKLFRKLILPRIDNAEPYTMLRLPSTSPAHASKSFQQKLSEWSVIREFCN